MKNLMITVLTSLLLLGCNEKSQPIRNNQEFYAWEKTRDGIYKQVQKDYSMNEAVCKNVINVLNAMSTKQPQSDWALSHTTDSTFECWPAGVNPNGPGQTKIELSKYSDNPPRGESRSSANYDPVQLMKLDAECAKQALRVFNEVKASLPEGGMAQICQIYPDENGHSCTSDAEFDEFINQLMNE